MLSDLDEPELWNYRSSQVLPDDFEAYWRKTLAESRSQARAAKRERAHGPLSQLRVDDVSFSGFAGQPVSAWLRLPLDVHDKPPIVVEFVGYGRGRGRPIDDLAWAASGFAHLVVDARGQGSVWSPGNTADPSGSGPQAPGFLTKGIEGRESHYYRRLVTDAALGIEFARTLPEIDASRVVAYGHSQGGALAVAAGVLTGVDTIYAVTPFLCDFPRALQIHDTDPYSEAVRYLAIHPELEDSVAETLRYVDVVNFGRMAAGPAQFYAALRDTVCKPSTIFGAFHAYAGEKQMHVLRYSGHDAGGTATLSEIISDAQDRLG